MTTATTENIDVTTCIDVCNNLLRGEISAVETYEKAVEKFKGEPEAEQLQAISNEHAQSVVELRANVLAMGGRPDSESGLWGTFANTVQSAANFFGDNAAQFALLEGEEYGLGLYDSALQNEAVMAECKDLICDKLIPRVKKHILALNAMRAAE